MAGIEQLIFDIIARDSASPGFERLAKAAQGAGGNVSDLSRKIDELGRKSATARVSLAGDREAQASLDKLDARLLTLTHKTARPDISIEGAAKATAEISALDLELDKLGRKGGSADAAAGALSGVAGGGGISGGGMGALIAAGVALSPVLVTLGIGLAGIAAAAYGVAKPIENAAQKAGGLQKNMKLLDPEQHAVALSLLGLQHQYDAFQQSLKPEVLGIFSQGIKLAGQIMLDVEPVAQATGAAFGQFLGQFGATLDDPQWRQFWAFMAATAPQDMRLLGNLIIDLTNDLPPLLEGLQPAATLLLRMADGAAKVAGVLALLLPAAEGSAKGTSILGDALNYAALGFELTNPVAAAAIGLFDRVGASAERAAVGGTAAAKSMSMFLTGGTFAAAAGQLHLYVGQVDALGTATSRDTPLLQGYAHQTANVADQHHLAAVWAQEGTKWLTHYATELGQGTRKSADFIPPAVATAAGLKAIAAQGALAAKAVNDLTAAENKSLSVQAAYAGDLVTTANDAQALHDKLKLSAGQIGLHTQAQRDSFAAANQYIGDLAKTATDAIASGHGVNAAIAAISAGLPVLDSAKTKNRAYWGEIATLVGWLDRLRAEKAISEAIHVSGTGVWSVTPGKIGLPGGTAGGPFGAAGMLVTGGIPGKDSRLIMAMPGELLVPTHMVNAGAVDHLRGQIPGFAAGGVVGSYAGNPAGLGPWARGELNATANAVVQSTAQAIIAGIRSAAAGSGFGGAGGPGGGAPAANAALARSLYQALLTPASWAAWNYVAMRESGWNQFARNPSSGAYGIPQALPESKLPFAGQAAGGSNPMAQIGWMWNYMATRYGGPVGAAAHEAAFNWYDTGYGVLPPGLSLSWNGTGRPEPLVPRRSGSTPPKIVLEFRSGTSDIERAMISFLKKYVQVAGGGDARVAFAP
jgi:hypothetical protein